MDTINQIVDRQRSFFNSGRSRNVSFRIKALKVLQQVVRQKEGLILEALRADLGKARFEGYLTEVGIVRDELRHMIAKTRKWARPRRVRTPIYHIPAISRVYPEPYGVTLIISPWNYPFQLAMAPAIASIAAGNCVIIKPSEFSENTSRLIAEICEDNFDPGHIAAVTGDVNVARELLSEPFDYIFFTGSTNVGKSVMKAAAEHLTPVTLELGGKSPCIVSGDADIAAAAKKIASGKFINAGQTCIAPDYVLVHRSVRERLVSEIIDIIGRFYGPDPKQSPDYPRIISRKHFDRLSALMNDTTILSGGQTDSEDRYIAPTLVEAPPGDHPLMTEEIFGPILPVLEYDAFGAVIDAVRSRPRPLALYLFTKNPVEEQRALNELSFGGGCINDTLIHFATPYLPFGGVGYSGMGQYHGKAGFNTFSHEKGIMKARSFFDNPFRYPPYMKSLKMIKTVLR